MPLKPETIKFFHSLGKTLYWLLLNSVFGLSPLIIVLILSAVFPNLPYTLIEIIQKGSILFFCATMTGSALVDFILSDIRFKKYIESGLYLLPGLIVLTSGIIFGQLFFHPEETPRLDTFILIQNLILIFAFIYCSSIKTILFINR